MSVLLTSVIALLSVILVYILHHRRSQNATTVPVLRCFEPFTAFDVQLINHLNMKSLVRRHRYYGSTFQVSPMAIPPVIYTVAPENLKEIMTNGNDFGVEPLRGETMGPFCGKGFLTSDGDAWTASRRMLKPCFGKRYLTDLTNLDKAISALVATIDKAGGRVDLQPLLFDMFLDNSFQFLLGTEGKDDIGKSEKAPHSRSEFLKAFDSGLLGTGVRIMLGRLRFLAPDAGYSKACRSVHEWLDHYISRETSMARNLGAHTGDIGYIRSQVLQSMLASKETTAVLISNAMFLLARHPTIWQRLRDAISQRERQEELFTFDNLTAFPYLQNILKEALRIYPVFPLNGRIALRNTMLPVSPNPFNRGVTQPEPVPVPKGSTLIMSFYTLHRDEKVFGGDVESFIPDRWNKIHPSQYEYMPFGAGQRACLGREKSQAEAALVIARLATRFRKLESQDDRDFKPQVGISTCNGNGCNISLRS